MKKECGFINTTINYLNKHLSRSNGASTGLVPIKNNLMEEFKIKLFEKENDINFPSFKTLSNEECDLVKKKALKKFDVQNNDVKDFMWRLQNNQESVIEFNAKENLNMKLFFDFIKIQALDKILINWNLFDEIDEFSFKDFVNYYSDIWFSEADDIEIFDSSLTWILSIRHDGYMSVWKQN